jgi:hypothetical protein
MEGSKFVIAFETVLRDVRDMTPSRVTSAITLQAYNIFVRPFNLT